MVEFPDPVCPLLLKAPRAHAPWTSGLAGPSSHTPCRGQLLGGDSGSSHRGGTQQGIRGTQADRAKPWQSVWIVVVSASACCCLVCFPVVASSSCACQDASTVGGVLFPGSYDAVSRTRLESVGLGPPQEFGWPRTRPVPGLSMGPQQVSSRCTSLLHGQPTMHSLH